MQNIQHEVLSKPCNHPTENPDVKCTGTLFSSEAEIDGTGTFVVTTCTDCDGPAPEDTTPWDEPFADE